MQCIKSCIFYYKSRENLYQYYKSRKNPYQVLQVMDTIVWMCNKMKGFHNKIIITIVPSLPGNKNVTHLLPLALLVMLCIHNNTDGNKLVIFYSIVLYYDDTCIVLQVQSKIHHVPSAQRLQVRRQMDYR